MTLRQLEINKAISTYAALDNGMSRERLFYFVLFTKDIFEKKKHFKYIRFYTLTIILVCIAYPELRTAGLYYYTNDGCDVTHSDRQRGRVQTAESPVRLLESHQRGQRFLQ